MHLFTANDLWRIVQALLRFTVEMNLLYEPRSIELIEK